MRQSALILKAMELEKQGIFLGGALPLFELAGRKLMMTLLHLGLTPDSKVLDIGCGCLRGGYWLIHFLKSGGYFGIEPNETMLQAGVNHLLEPGLVEQKKPHLDTNDQFDFSVFGTTFDYFVARSIWTHASKNQIQVMLDQFVAHSHAQSEFITSFIDTEKEEADYKGSDWVGRSHQSTQGGMIMHSFKWIQQECHQRNLMAVVMPEREWNYGDQVWIRIKKRP